MQVAALSYLNDGWNFTATFAYGTGRNGTTPGSFAPSWLNYDLTATKTFGKWEIGPIAFGSADLSSPYAGYSRQSQFAMGGLLGYNFGPVNLQLKLTTDLAEQQLRRQGHAGVGEYHRPDLDRFRANNNRSPRNIDMPARPGCGRFHGRPRLSLSFDAQTDIKFVWRLGPAKRRKQSGRPSDASRS